MLCSRCCPCLLVQCLTAFYGTAWAHLKLSSSIVTFSNCCFLILTTLQSCCKCHLCRACFLCSILAPSRLLQVFVCHRDTQISLLAGLCPYPVLQVTTARSDDKGDPQHEGGAVGSPQHPSPAGLYHELCACVIALDVVAESSGSCVSGMKHEACLLGMI